MIYVFDKAVNASEIWPTAKNYVDEGAVLGLVRGFNIEVETSQKTFEWLSCEFIEGELNEVFNDEFHHFLYSQHGWTPTGRYCFRGYGEERWDPRERDTYVCNIGPRKRTDDVPDSEFDCLR